MRRYLIFALVAAVVAGAAGCGATAPVKLTEVPKAAKLSKSRERPLRYEVVFAPVVLGQTEKPRGQFAAAVKPDPEKIRSELAGTLKEFKVFDKLETIEAQTEEEAIAKARENGADLLLTTSIDRLLEESKEQGHATASRQ